MARPGAAPPDGLHEGVDAGRVEREVGSLALSELEGAGALLMMRAVSWHNTLARLGMRVPLVILHDLGGVLTGMARPAAQARGAADPRLGESWRRLLVEVGASELARVPAAWKHRDPMVGVVLSRILGAVRPQLPADARLQRVFELPVDVQRYARMDVASAHDRHPQDQALAWMTTLTSHRLLPILEVEQIDLDALRLLGLFGSSHEGAAALDLADLYQVIASPNLADVVDFSMELLPSLLEVRRDSGQQAFGMDGYAAIERRGQLDDLMLSQLAYDEDLFEQKLVAGELFYYTHEKQLESERHVHQILVDGSASMRGVREVFARGLALALGKRLSALGESVRLRFFDARVYPGVAVRASEGGDIPYVLQFRAEHGRNYARVARELLAELSAPRGPEGQQILYLLTHGQCRFPPELLQQIGARAPVHAVYILPGGTVELPEPGAFRRVHVLDAQALAQGRRVGHARRIIQDAERDLGRLRSGSRRRGGGPR